MRVDKFLSTVNILKRRSIAQDMCENNAVYINNTIAKPSKEVRVGDTISLRYLEYTKIYQVIALPTTKNISKSQKCEYVKEIYQKD